MAKRSPRPGRTLLVFFISVAVLYGLAALGGTWKPQLGLDLEGGTRITLTTVSNVNATKMKQAASIIDARVNGSGVSEAEVTTQGNKNIVVEIPGKNSKSLVDSVKRVSLVAERNTAVQLAFEGGVLQLHAGSGDEAMASESIEAQVTGEDLTTGFNPQFLLDGLTAIETPTVELAFTQASKPVVISGVDPDSGIADGAFKYLLMPRRLLS